MEAKSGSKLIVCLDVIPIRCTKKQGQNNGTIVSAFAFISCRMYRHSLARYLGPFIFKRAVQPSADCLLAEK